MSTSQFYFRTTPGEHIRALIPLEQEGQCALTGRVLDSGGLPVQAAAVLLYQGRGCEELTAWTATGDDGSFCFGPLPPDTLYNIRIYKNNTKVRELEIKTEV